MTELAKIEAAPAPAVQSESAALISMIERAARDPAVDIAKMERLFEMHERIEARRAEQAFNAAMAAAQAEIGPVVRNKKNSETHSTYADLRAVSDAIKPIITRHGFAPSYGTEPCPREGYERVICDLAHRDGHSRRYMADVPFDNKGPKGTVNKSNTHAFGSTLSYGRRYLSLLMFDVATKDDDGNASGNGMITEAQVAELKRLIVDAQADIGKVCEVHSVETLDDLTGAQFQKVKAALIARMRQGGRR